MVTSAITAADRAFAVLVAEPAPLAVDTRGIPGLPHTSVRLDELRTLLSGRQVDAAAIDATWRRLCEHARSWGPAWVVGAVGVAVPGLVKVAARLSARHTDQAEDIDSEVMAGFLHALRTEDLTAPRLWLRLLWAAWRAGHRARQIQETVELPAELPTGATTPRPPYGHPDLILGRAVAAGVLTRYEADLIGDTRIGDVLVEQLADEQGLAAPVLRMRRVRAERALVAAMERGDLQPPLRSGITQRTSSQ
jgi:hypothetical protein